MHSLHHSAGRGEPPLSNSKVLLHDKLELSDLLVGLTVAQRIR